MTCFNRLRQLVPLALLALAACHRPPPVAATAQEPPKPAPTAPATGQPPLKLAVPILAIMLNTINEASYVIFRAGISDEPLNDDQWRRTANAAIALVGDASLITLPGAGPNDAAWTSDPEWMQFAKEMQLASLDVGKAAVSMDREGLGQATARLAQACQSCHARFSSRLVTAPPASQVTPN